MAALKARAPDELKYVLEPALCVLGVLDVGELLNKPTSLLDISLHLLL